jgi:hypothetical protein
VWSIFSSPARLVLHAARVVPASLYDAVPLLFLYHFLMPLTCFFLMSLTADPRSGLLQPVSASDAELSRGTAAAIVY